MRAAYSVAQVREAERLLMATLPAGALMQRAAAGLEVATARFLGRVYAARVLLLVGAGDNGADALWAGARLATRGARVDAVLLGKQRDGAALDAFVRAGGRLDARPDEVQGVGSDLGYDVVLDGLVGIGGRGALRPEAAALVAGLDPARTVAVDLPSGVDADTGAVEGAAARAALTVTFGCLKPGLLVGEGRRRAGRVELVDIGLRLPAPDVEVLDPADVVVAPPIGPQDKYTRGVVGVVAGSERYPGAAVLAAGGAVRAGAGMVRFAGGAPAAEQVRRRWPEALVSEAVGAAVLDAGRVQAWVVGPGLGTDDTAAAAVEAVLSSDVPVLVDADALTLLAAHDHWLSGRDAPTVLTPHDREFARFGCEVGPDRIGAARDLAVRLRCTVLLKGEATVVATPDGHAFVNPTGTTHLATAGTGDVLSGATGTHLARGGDTGLAAARAAYLHGLAGSLSAGAGTTSAGRVLDAWPDAVAAVAAAAAAGRLER